MAKKKKTDGTKYLLKYAYETEGEIFDTEDELRSHIETEYSYGNEFDEYEVWELSNPKQVKVESKVHLVDTA